MYPCVHTFGRQGCHRCEDHLRRRGTCRLREDPMRKSHGGPTPRDSIQAGRPNVHCPLVSRCNSHPDVPFVGISWPFARFGLGAIQLLIVVLMTSLSSQGRPLVQVCGKCGIRHAESSTHISPQTTTRLDYSTYRRRLKPGITTCGIDPAAPRQ